MQLFLHSCVMSCDAVPLCSFFPFVDCCQNDVICLSFIIFKPPSSVEQTRRDQQPKTEQSFAIQKRQWLHLECGVSCSAQKFPGNTSVVLFQFCTDSLHVFFCMNSPFSQRHHYCATIDSVVYVWCCISRSLVISWTIRCRHLSA